MSSLWRKWWLYPVAFVTLVALAFAVLSDPVDNDVDLDVFLEDIQAGRVIRVEVDGTRVKYEVVGGDGKIETSIERGDSIRQILADNGIEPGSPEYPTIVAGESSFFTGLLRLVFQFLPLVFIGGIVYFFYRRAQANRRSLPFALVTNLDPVCRAIVNPGSAAGSSTFMGTTYHFCSADHKEQFDSDPQKYLLQK